MRKLLTCFIALWAVSVIAQNKQLLYGWEDVPQSLLLNPGSKVLQKAHYGVPFLSQIHFNGGSSGVSAFDIFGISSVDINTRITNKIFELKNTDFFTATEQLEYISFGWRSREDVYYSGGVYQELDFITYFPRDLAILAWEGNRDYIDYEFDLGEISATGDLLTVYHFGANKAVSKKLTVGIRAKLYSSIISFRSTNNQGTFVTTLGDGDVNIYEHTVQNANVSLNTSGYASLRELDGANEVANTLLKRALLTRNLGVGLDFGVTYDFTSNITASASFLDVGFVFHNNDVESYEAKGSYTLNGIELIFPPLADGETTLPYYDNLTDEIEEAIPVDTLNNSYSQFRPVKFNAGLKYSFGRPTDGRDDCDCRGRNESIARNQAVGLQYYSIFRPKGPQMAGTVFYYRRLFSFLSAKATYTFDPYSISNVGLGIASDIGKVNFYIALDNLLRLENIAKAKSISLQLGFNIKIDQE